MTGCPPGPSWARPTSFLARRPRSRVVSPGEDIATWKELTVVGGMEVRAVSGVIVVRDAKTSQHLVFSEQDYASHRRYIQEHSRPLVLLRVLERVIGAVQLVACALYLAKRLGLR